MFFRKLQPKLPVLSRSQTPLHQTSKMTLKFILALTLLVTIPSVTHQSIYTDKALVFQAFEVSSKTIQTFHLGLTKMSQTVIHPPDDLTFLKRKTALTIIVLNFLAGLSYRILLFKSIFKTGSLTLYNLMSGIEECPKMLGAIAWTIICGSSLVLDEPLNKQIGEPACRLVISLVILGILHWFIGGLGVAVIRWLIIKRSTKFKMDEQTLAIIISLTALVLSATFTCAVLNTQRQSFDPMNVCMGRSEDFSIILFDYSHKTSLFYDSISLTILRLLVFLMVVTELGLYLSIWNHLRENDKAIARYLHKDVIKLRKRKNVINLYVSIISFVFEVVWFLGLILVEVLERKLLKDGTGHQSVFAFWITRRLLMTFDGLSSVLRIAFSPQLRAECIQIWKSINEGVCTIWHFLTSRTVNKRICPFPSSK